MIDGIYRLTNRWSQPLTVVLKGRRMNYEGWSESKARSRQRLLSSVSLDVKLAPCYFA